LDGISAQTSRIFLRVFHWTLQFKRPRRSFIVFWFFLKVPLALNYCHLLFNYPRFSRIIPVHQIRLGIVSTFLSYELFQPTVIRLDDWFKSTGGWPPTFFTTSVSCLMKSRATDILSGNPVYYTIVAELRREAPQFEQRLLLFTLSLPSFGGRRFRVRIWRW